MRAFARRRQRPAAGNRRADSQILGQYLPKDLPKYFFCLVRYLRGQENPLYRYWLSGSEDWGNLTENILIARPLPLPRQELARIPTLLPIGADDNAIKDYG